MVVVILPDGGRSYLSKIYSDAWMRQYGFLERGPDLTVGDVLRAQARRRRAPVAGHGRDLHFRVRDAVALLHEHRVSQLPVVSAHDPAHDRGGDRRARAAAPRRRGPRACSTPRSWT